MRHAGGGAVEAARSRRRRPPGGSSSKRSDEQIERAVAHAEPMVLRGLLYQLTGDEEVAATGIAIDPTGFQTAHDGRPRRGRGAAAPQGGRVPRSAYRDAGAEPLGIGPEERLPASLSLTLGEEIDDEEFGFCLEELALDPWARGPGVAATPPPPERLAGLLGDRHRGGAGRPNVALQLKRAGIPFTRHREERRRRRHVVREPLPGRAGRHPEPLLHAHLRRRLPVSRARSATGPRTSATSTGSRTPSSFATTSSSTPRCAR